MWMQGEDLENVFLKGKQYSMATAFVWPSECFTSRVRHSGCCAMKDLHKSPSAKMQCETPPRGSAFSLALGSASLAVLWNRVEQ